MNQMTQNEAMRSTVIRLALAMTMAAGTASAAELVVTKSTVPGIEPGVIIDGGSTMTLKKDHKLTLMSPTGKIINLVGPYSGIVDQAAPTSKDEKVVNALSALIAGQSKNVSQLGATRTTGQRNSTQVWVVQVGGEGKQCIQAEQTPKLWLPTAATGGVTMERVGGERIQIAWPVSESIVSWPSNVPIVDGAAYKLNGKAFTLHIVARTDNKAEQTIALSEKGCDDQAMTLVQTAQ